MGNDYQSRAQYFKVQSYKNVKNGRLMPNLATYYIQRKKESLASYLLNIICCQNWYKSKSDYTNRTWNYRALICARIIRFPCCVSRTCKMILPIIKLLVTFESYLYSLKILTSKGANHWNLFKLSKGFTALVLAAQLSFPAWCTQSCRSPQPHLQKKWQIT